MQLHTPGETRHSASPGASIQKHPDLIYDVGAHRGEDTEFYLHKGFRVVAIEADPQLAASCRERFKDFIERGQLTMIEGAITAVPATSAGQSKVAFYKNEEKSVWGTASTDWAELYEKLGGPSHVVEVNAINFAEVLEEHGIPHYLKIDIEGSDMICLEALRGFRPLPDYLSFESDKRSFKKIRQEFDLLSQLGYESFQPVEQSTIPEFQTPPFPSKEGEYVDRRFEFGSSGMFGAELPGRWQTKQATLRRYWFVWAGYYLFGENGITMGWRFRGAERLRLFLKRLLTPFTSGAIPGWYDTHSRLVPGRDTDGAQVEKTRSATVTG